MRGETPPRPHETARLLEACGFDPALTQQVVAAGSHTLLAILLASYRPCQLVDPFPLSACRLTIDKLAIVFNPVDADRLLAVARKHGSPARPKHYRMAFYGHGVRVDHAPMAAHAQMRRLSRIEFNPDHALGKSNPYPDARSFVSKLWPLLEPAEAEITQIHVTVDLPVSVHDVQGITDRKQKFNVFIGDGLQTIYCGTRDSGCQIAIYDKRLEQHEKGLSAGVAAPLTRFEARIQRSGLELLALPTLANPFKALRLFLLRPDGLPLERRLIVEYARHVGLPSLKGELAPNEFNALCRELEQSDATPIVPHPRDVYEEKWPQVARSLLAALRLGGTP